jgi:phage terminase large subunit-like protein
MRAEYVPTADQRALVESAAAFGLTQADIAQQLKIDVLAGRSCKLSPAGWARRAADAYHEFKADRLT